MAQAQREVARGSRAMQKSANDMKLTFQEMATFSSRVFRTAGIAFAGAFGARAILGVADAAKSLTAQLKLATSEYGSFAQAQKDVRSIAQTTRSDLLATADLYSALQRSSGQLGTTQEQTARAAQTVAEAFKISGAATSEQSAATRQLIQAFQSGVLRGDEFNSVMENAPRLAKLLADSLGVTVGHLRAMAEAGQLTSDKLLHAFTDPKFTAGIDQQFAQLPVTFDQAMGQVYNAAVITFGEFDSGGQFSTALANFVTQGTEGFASIGQAAYDLGATIRGLFDALDEVRAAFGVLSDRGGASMDDLIGKSFGLRDALRAVLGTIDGVANGLVNIFQGPANIARTLFGQKPVLGTVNTLGAFDKATQSAALRRIASQGLDPSEFPGRKPPPFRAIPTGGRAGGGGRAKQAPRDRSDDVAYQFEREEMQAQADILRAKQELAGTSEERAKLALDLIQLEHDQEAAEINDRVRKAQKDFADGKITKAALDQVTVAADVLRAKNDEKTAVERRAFIEQQLTRNEEAQFDAKDQQLKFAIDSLQVSDDLARTAAEHRRIQLQILDAQIEQRRLELQHTKDLAIRNGATQQEIDNIQAQIDQLSVERAQGAAQINNSTMGPLESYLSGLPQTVDDINERMQALKVEGLQGIIDALSHAGEGWKAMRDIALRVIQDIIQKLIQMNLEAMLFKIIGGAAGGIGGAGGGFGGDIFSAFAASSGGGGFGLPGFASGGSFNIGGNSGIDRNVLSLNGLPIARVSYGERVSVSNDNSRMSAGGGVTIHAPITINGNADRQTIDQAASVLRRRVASVTRKGLS